MIKYLIVIIISLNFSAYAKKSIKTSKWQKHYNLVLSDIKSVEILGTRELGLRIRLFELYGEKLTLLLERESSLRIRFLKKGDPKQINALVKKQKKTLNKIELIAAKIENQTKDGKVLAKINYYRSLNYYITKSYKKFYVYIKKAEKHNKDKQLAYLINTKIADYHFNEKQYKQAARYYKKLIYNKKSGWITKHYYNLAWSELKIHNFDRALKYLKVAASYEKKKGFFKIGDQVVDSILLFHAYSKKTSEGIRYFDEIGISNFDNLLKYLHYVFENGDKKNIDLVFKRIEKNKLSGNQQFVLLSKKVIVYRALKRFGTLQKKFSIFKKYYSKQKLKIKKKNRAELVTAVRSYTGYLQELVKSRGMITEKKRRSYLFFIANNFSVLRSIDKKNGTQYTYYEGETYFSIDRYKKASKVYMRGIREAKRSKRTKGPFLVKMFDSLFKSMEKQKKRSMKDLVFTYQSYLEIYPKGPKSNQVYQRLINLYRSKGQSNNMLALLKVYNKSFPKERKIQKDFYKQILNKYIDLKNIRALSSLRAMVEKGFLGFTPKESKKIEKVITQIYFSKYEDLAKQGKYKEAIAGFELLFNDKKSKYVLRVDSLRKKMYYENMTLEYSDLSQSLLTSFKFFNSKVKRTYKNEFLFYIQNICLGDMHDECRNLIKRSLIDKTIVVSNNMKNLYFKLTAVYSKNFKSLMKNAKTKEDKNYIFKLLLAKDSQFKSLLYREFYKDPKKRSIIEGEVSKRALSRFYDTLSIEKAELVVKNVAIPSLKSSVLSQFSKLRRQLGKIKFKFPVTPIEENITEAMFMKFGQSFDQQAGKVFKDIDNIIHTTHPNFLPFVLTRIINRYDTELDKFKKFIPVSKNADLEKAMSDAVTNFQKIFDQKSINYRALYYQSINKTERGSGARIYNNNLMIAPFSRGMGDLVLWQE